MRSRRTALVLVIGAAVVITALVVSVTVFAAHGMGRSLEGRAFGEGKAMGACVDEGLRRIDAACASATGPCGLEGVSFGEGCAQVATTTPELCGGVSTERDVQAFGAWARAWCQEHGRASQYACEQLLTDVRASCSAAARRAGR